MSHITLNVLFFVEVCSVFIHVPILTKTLHLKRKDIIRVVYIISDFYFFQIHFTESFFITNNISMKMKILSSPIRNTFFTHLKNKIISPLSRLTFFMYLKNEIISPLSRPYTPWRKLIKLNFGI